MNVVNPSLDELTQYLRQTLPQANAMQNLQLRADVGAVTFRWNSRDFLVRPSLEVLELKGSNVVITGASMLMQAALLTKKRNDKLVGGMVETLRQAEDLIKANQKQNGVSLLDTVKKTLATLAGKHG